MSWQPLSVRRGAREIDGPYEGVPLHLRPAATEWLRAQFGWYRQFGLDEAFMINLASTLRVAVRPSSHPTEISREILDALYADDDLFLDALDATLHLRAGSQSGVLDSTLHTAGSAWKVKADARGIERRVPDEVAASYSAASAPKDAVSSELAEAWAAAFGRSPNPSDAWDHAIKAVEDLLIPIVVPKVVKANLGGVAGELGASPRGWTFGLESNGSRNNGETLEGLLRLMWPNPDRHGGAAKRTPSQDEAEMVVQVAVCVINMCRGRLRKV